MNDKPKLILTVRKDADQAENQFWIDSNWKTAEGEWEDIYVGISGYFGHLGPHVFAAAPDLYAALEVLVNHPVHEDTAMGRRARAALAKARGEA